jgi:hypothetical protein
MRGDKSLAAGLQGFYHVMEVFNVLIVVIYAFLTSLALEV